MFRPLLAVLLAAGLTAPALAQSPTTTYVVGVEELDYFPVYAVREGQYAGAAREILDAFAADAGIRFQYQPLPIKRLFAELAAGGIDFKFPDAPAWGGDAKSGAQIAYSGTVIGYTDGVMVRADRKGKGLDGFQTLGTVAGFTPVSWRKQIESGAVKLVENPQMRALQRQVVAGRIDGAYANVAVATHILENDLKQPGALVFDPSLPHVKDGYQLSSAKHPDLIRRFDAWLKDNPAKVQAIKDKYRAE